MSLFGPFHPAIVIILFAILTFAFEWFYHQGEVNMTQYVWKVLAFAVIYLLLVLIFKKK